MFFLDTSHPFLLISILISSDLYDNIKSCHRLNADDTHTIAGVPRAVFVVRSCILCIGLFDKSLAFTGSWYLRMFTIGTLTDGTWGRTPLLLVVHLGH